MAYGDPIFYMVNRLISENNYFSQVKKKIASLDF